MHRDVRLHSPRARGSSTTSDPEPGPPHGADLTGSHGLAVATPRRTLVAQRTVGYGARMSARRAPLIAALLAGCAPGGANSDGSGTSTTDSTTTSGTTTTLPTTGASTTGAPLDCDTATSDLFEKRIAPLLATDRPKSCNTCHLSGVDMAMFVQGDACQTMACLDARGLVDLTDPASSTVLSWISRADPASPLIDQKVIDEEYAGFLAWIEASAECGLCYTGDAPCGEPVEATCAADDPKNDEYVDPGDCSALTREALFRHNVYAWRDRCFPCHFDNKDYVAPKWVATGACDLASLQTMRNVLDSGLVNLDQPDQSLLLLKPLAESAGGVEHGGGDKFHDAEDVAYLDFRAWIRREADCAP